MLNLKIANRDLVVVMDGRKAIFMQNDGDEKFPNLIVREVKTRVDAPNRDLHTDRPGRVHQSAASFRSAVEQTDRHDAAEQAFIQDVSDRLAEVVVLDKSCRIVVVAPPRALGVLRRSYTSDVRVAIRAEIDHDLVRAPTYEIETFLTGRRMGRKLDAGG